MAGIDKTYVTCLEDYVEVKDWASSVGTVTDDFGNTFSPLDWMAEYEETEFNESIKSQRNWWIDFYEDPTHLQKAKESLGQDWEFKSEEVGELVLWNTPTYFDIWLIRNCPIDFIQKRLQFQYSDSYEEIKERRSEYDLYVRPAASKHFKVLPLSSFPRIRARNLWLYIQSEGSDWMYDDEMKLWSHWLECRQWNTNTMDAKGPITRRKLKRIISKCGFPAGVKLRVCSNYGHVFEVVIKK